MTIFRWIVGVIAALMATSAVVSFLIFIAFDAPVWLARARRFLHWTGLALLSWFIVEIWGRVIVTLIGF